jgi:hypothetical protein
MAANRDETGGRLPIWAANWWLTPCWARPLVRVRGRALARPAIISETWLDRRLQALSAEDRAIIARATGLLSAIADS